MSSNDFFCPKIILNAGIDDRWFMMRNRFSVTSPPVLTSYHCLYPWTYNQYYALNPNSTSSRPTGKLLIILNKKCSPAGTWQISRSWHRRHTNVQLCLQFIKNCLLVSYWTKYILRIFLISLYVTNFFLKKTFVCWGLTT